MTGIPITCTEGIFRVNSGLSLDSEDDLPFGCQNISHQQLFFSEEDIPSMDDLSIYTTVTLLYFPSKGAAAKKKLKHSKSWNS